MRGPLRRWGSESAVYMRLRHGAANQKQPPHNPFCSYTHLIIGLPPGTRLGPYEITAQIGEGGMGEVYRATDTKLKRQVAIKVLPASVAGDAERLARFQREAEVLASLNHPNIAAIYGLEEARRRERRS